MSPVELVKIGGPVVDGSGNFVGGYDRQVDVVVSLLRVHPVALRARLIIQPYGIHDTADRVEGSLAAHAMHDQYGRTLLRRSHRIYRGIRTFARGIHRRPQSIKYRRIILTPRNNFKLKLLYCATTTPRFLVRSHSITLAFISASGTKHASYFPKIR